MSATLHGNATAASAANGYPSSGMRRNQRRAGAPSRRDASRDDYIPTKPLKVPEQPEADFHKTSCFYAIFQCLNQVPQFYDRIDRKLSQSRGGINTQPEDVALLHALHDLMTNVRAGSGKEVKTLKFRRAMTFKLPLKDTPNPECRIVLQLLLGCLQQEFYLLETGVLNDGDHPDRGDCFEDIVASRQLLTLINMLFCCGLTLSGTCSNLSCQSKCSVSPRALFILKLRSHDGVQEILPEAAPPGEASSLTTTALADVPNRELSIVLPGYPDPNFYAALQRVKLIINEHEAYTFVKAPIPSSNSSDLTRSGSDNSEQLANVEHRVASDDLGGRNGPTFSPGEATRPSVLTGDEESADTHLSSGGLASSSEPTFPPAEQQRPPVSTGDEESAVIHPSSDDLGSSNEPTFQLAEEPVSTGDEESADIHPSLDDLAGSENEPTLQPAEEPKPSVLTGDKELTAMAEGNSCADADLIASVSSQAAEDQRTSPVEAEGAAADGQRRAPACDGNPCPSAEEQNASEQAATTVTIPLVPDSTRSRQADSNGQSPSIAGSPIHISHEGYSTGDASTVAAGKECTAGSSQTASCMASQYCTVLGPPAKKSLVSEHATSGVAVGPVQAHGSSMILNVKVHSIENTGLGTTTSSASAVAASRTNTASLATRDGASCRPAQAPSVDEPPLYDDLYGLPPEMLQSAMSTLVDEATQEASTVSRCPSCNTDGTLIFGEDGNQTLLSTAFPPVLIIDFQAGSHLSLPLSVNLRKYIPYQPDTGPFYPEYTVFAVICRYGNDASEPSEHAAFIKRRCESGGASHYEWYSTHGAIEVVPEKDILNFPVCLAFYKQTQDEQQAPVSPSEAGVTFARGSAHVDTRKTAALSGTSVGSVSGTAASTSASSHGDTSTAAAFTVSSVHSGASYASPPAVRAHEGNYTDPAAQGLISIRRPIPARGLQNIINNCYFTVSVQCLNQIFLLHEELSAVIRGTVTRELQGRNDSVVQLQLSLNEDDGQQPVTIAFYELMCKLRIAKKRDYLGTSPNGLLKEFKKKVPRFNNHSQHDCYEALLSLLECMREEAVARWKGAVEREVENQGHDERKTRSLVRVYSRQIKETFLDRVIGLKLQVTTTCGVESCGYANAVLQPCYHLSLSLGPLQDGPMTLESCLARFFCKEPQGSRSALDCYKCNERRFGPVSEMVDEESLSSVGATREVKIKQLPRVLILHLKRFQQTHFGIEKRDDGVTTPEVLDLFDFCCSPGDGMEKCAGAPAGVGFMYSLFALIVHKGNIHGGHYVAYVKTRWPCSNSGVPSSSRTHQCTTSSSVPGQHCGWYLINDLSVTAVPEHTALNQNAYMLFYEQKSDADIVP